MRSYQAEHPGTIGTVSRISNYDSADVDGAIRRLRQLGLDPERVSLACALDHLDECDGTVETIRPPGTLPDRCTYPNPAHPAER